MTPFDVLPEPPITEGLGAQGLLVVAIGLVAVAAIVFLVVATIRYLKSRK